MDLQEICNRHAMSIVQHFGKSSLFITMTCNPNWPEIVNNIGVGETANLRPDIMVSSPN